MSLISPSLAMHLAIIVLTFQVWERFVMASEHLNTEAKVAKVGYILYDANPGEGWSFRRLLLHRALALLRRLSQYSSMSAYQFVLVLPPFSDRGTRAYAHNWDEYYNLAVFKDSLRRRNEKFEVITAAEYIEKVGFQINVSLVIHVYDLLRFIFSFD